MQQLERVQKSIFLKGLVPHQYSFLNVLLVFWLQLVLAISQSQHLEKLPHFCIHGLETREGWSSKVFHESQQDNSKSKFVVIGLSPNHCYNLLPVSLKCFPTHKILLVWLCFTLRLQSIQLREAYRLLVSRNESLIKHWFLWSAKFSVYNYLNGKNLSLLVWMVMGIQYHHISIRKSKQINSKTNDSMSGNLCKAG